MHTPEASSTAWQLVGTSLISAGIGALFAYAGGWIREIRERRRMRHSMATFLLSELRAAEVSLRTVYEHPIGVLPPETFQSFRMVGEALRLLKADTVAALVDFADYIGAVRALQAKAVERVLDEATAKIEIRIFTVSGLQRVHNVKTLLEREGGKLIPFQPLDVPPELIRGSEPPPPLPPSPFD